MKKIFFVAVIVTTLYSCTKLEQPLNYYHGDQLAFSYNPTNLEPFAASPVITGGIAKLQLGDKPFDLQVINTADVNNMIGGCFITEAPIVPGGWQWNNSSLRYESYDFNWNVSWGFTHTTCNVWVVDRLPGSLSYALIKVSASWGGNPPQPANWVASFNSPGDRSGYNFPLMGRVQRLSNNTYVTSF